MTTKTWDEFVTLSEEEAREWEKKCAAWAEEEVV